MATLRTNMVRYAFDTRTTDLATNTTLGTATLHTFTSGGGTLNITIPETTSRTFLSVMAVVTFRDRFTVANEITGVRMSSSVNGVAAVVVDRSFTQANTGDHLFDCWTLDITDNFNTNFGASTSATLSMGLAVSTTAASNIGGSITCEIWATYRYDDSVGTTRVKTIGIPIQSHHTTLTTVQQEIGTTGGTTNAPASQIPALDTYLPEASKSYKQIFLVSTANDASTAVTDINPFIQIDAAAEIARGLIGQALQTTMPWKDILDISLLITTNTTHALKMRADVTGRLVFAGAILWVTYTYNASTTTRIINQVLTGLTEPYDGLGTKNGSNFNTTDVTTLYSTLDIQEPGTLTLAQSAVVGNIGAISVSTNLLVSAGSQAVRTYITSGSAGEEPTIHRGDHSSGWTISRGKNKLPFSFSTNTVGRISFSGYCLISYTSDVPTSGPCSGNRIVNFFNAAYGTTLSTVIDVPAANQRTPVLGTPYTLTGVVAETRSRTTSISDSVQLLLEIKSTELTGTGFYTTGPRLDSILNELASYIQVFSLQSLYKTNNLTSSIRLNPETARRQLMWYRSSTFLSSWSTWYSYHQCAFTISGILTIDGVVAPDGRVVQLYSKDFDGNMENFGTSVTTGGTGTFSFTVTDSTRTYIAVHQNGLDNSASAPYTVGVTANANIQVRGAADIIPPVITTLTLPSTSSDPLVVKIYDDSGFSMYQITCKDRTEGKRYTVYSPIDGMGNNGFVHPFGGKSTVTGSGTIGDPYIFTIYRRGRWPTGLALDVRVQAVDTKGNEVDG